MLYLALVSFSGIISMYKGEIREISDSSLVDDLLKAGYITPYEPTDEAVDGEPAEKTKTKRKGKKNED